MVPIFSIPLIMASSISLILGLFFFVLYQRLKSNHKESVYYYLIFSFSALVSGVFLGAFFVLINSTNNLDSLNIANRIAVITAMFTIVLGMHYYISFFAYKSPKLLRWCYGISALFSIIALIPNPIFLDKAFYVTSAYYTGLEFGWLFELWGAWVLFLSAYCMVILVRVYLKQLQTEKRNYLGTLQILLVANTVWAITGIIDTLTSIQVIDLPPITWIGSFLVTCSIAWVLILNIETLYHDRKRLNQDLMHDHLTHALSRNYFEMKLDESLQALSQDTNSSIHVCIFDVDDFKHINDHNGHLNGDELLKGISKITKMFTRETDFFARFGGDEFVLLMLDLSDHQALQMLEQIKAKINESKFGIHNSNFSASCSFGLVKVDKRHVHLDNLPQQTMLQADKALYTAKRDGKNTIVLTSFEV